MTLFKQYKVQNSHTVVAVMSLHLYTHDTWFVMHNHSKCTYVYTHTCNTMMYFLNKRCKNHYYNKLMSTARTCS